MTKPIIRPGYLPAWLHQQLAHLDQREAAVTNFIASMDRWIAEQGAATPSHIRTAHDRAVDDFKEVQQQRSVLILGWDVLNAAP